MRSPPEFVLVIALAFVLGAASSVAAKQKMELFTEEGRSALQENLDAGPAPRGVWLTGKKKAAVEIMPCDDAAERLCGRLVWMQKLYDDKGRLRLDWYNPDESKRRQPMCGVSVLRHLRKNGDGEWEGKVYNPKDGKTYSGIVRPQSEDTLELRAFLGIELLGKSETWTRLESLPEDPLPCV
jgi:uncharacterized protein (DUF2147 family)